MRLSCVLLVLFCGRVCPFISVDHQAAWDSLLILDSNLSADVDSSCTNHDSRNQINRLPSVVFGLQFTQYVTLGIRTYPVFPLGGRMLYKSSFFDKGRPTIIMVHSELDSKPHLITGTTMKIAFNRNGPHNILAVDCGRELVPMKTRAELTRIIGESLAIDLNTLVESGYDVNKIHLIGHEIGAHVVGFAGKAFKILTNATLPRITALNPSSHCFENVSERGRLARGDASHVEVVHTISGYDMKKPLGHVDFYLVDSLSIDMWHTMVWKFYAEAIKNRGIFKGVQCDSLLKFNSGVCSSINRPIAVLSYGINANSTGSFFMRLEAGLPYGLGERGLHPLGE